MTTITSQIADAINRSQAQNEIVHVTVVSLDDAIAAVYDREVWDGDMYRRQPGC